MTVLSVRDYFGKTRAGQQDLLPQAAGIYVWTLDLGRVADPAFGGGGDVSERLVSRMKPVDHVVHGSVGPYHSASLRVDPKPLTEVGRARIDRLHAQEPSMVEWSLLCGMIFQRPLYVGKALNLRQRISAHLKDGSTLGDRLKDVGLRQSDCTILMAQLSGPDQPYIVQTADDSEGDDPHASGAYDDTDDDELAPGASPMEKNIDDLVRTAESITIRMSHPLLNRKQD